MDPVVIEVNTPSRRYTICIQFGLTAKLGDLVRGARVGSRAFPVSSPLVWKLHGHEMARALPEEEPIIVPDGERNKQLPMVSRIYDALVRVQADRGSAIVAIGGGVIGDMAGFAAASYLRGIGLVHVPTTLLAQVDSAIGGKVGVNHILGKNLIGAFYQPGLVAIDPALLSTLPRREFRAGLYEVLKYGMTSNRSLFDRVSHGTKAIFNRDPDTLVRIIAESCAVKAQVVSSDEREQGLRRVLNFGHTAGHALEAITKYRRFRHGEAIAYGMLAAAEVAVARGALAERSRQALARIIVELGPLPPIADLSTKQMLEAMRLDKKVVNGTLHYVLATDIGAWTIADDVTEKELTKALRKIGFAA
ncbi:MAG: 3-dehydroquinate synthase [Vicinamibacterales bacterium]